MNRYKLNDMQVKKSKPKEKDFKVSDGGGLHLLVKKNGTKCWRYSYRFGGKQKTLALGTYPGTTLSEARERHAEARKALEANKDPSQIKKQQRASQFADEALLFSNLANEWWEHQKGTWTEDHANRVWERLDKDVIPALGDMQITDITPQEIIPIIRKVESRGALDVASRDLQDIRRICTYCVQTGRLMSNPASDLGGILKKRKSRHLDSLPREELPEFLRLVDTYEKTGRKLTKLAIELLLLTFVRSGELRGARWEEFDLEGRLWRIPGERMKMNTEHLVPLSDQAIDVYKQIKEISGQYELLFPSEKNRFKPMSDNTMRKAIFRLGYDGETPGKSKAVPHGFRATASSILNEEGFNPDAIERQLAHQERNGVRAAYTHHARYLDDRSQMMQWWADYLDQLKKEK